MNNLFYQDAFRLLNRKFGLCQTAMWHRSRCDVLQVAVGFYGWMIHYWGDFSWISMYATCMALLSALVCITNAMSNVTVAVAPMNWIWCFQGQSLFNPNQTCYLEQSFPTFTNQIIQKKRFLIISKLCWASKPSHGVAIKELWHTM